jgi:adenylate cyclase, class 2
MRQENEVKFKLRDPKPIRAVLKRLGAKRGSRTIESNVCFYSRQLKIGNDRNLLRVRKEKSGKKESVIVCFKGKPHKAKRFKCRTETEFEAIDFDGVVSFFEEMGIPQYWRYEKTREKWTLGKAGIVIDRLPGIGWWMEIEGTDTIDSAIKKMQLDPKKGITKTYRQLWVEFKGQKNPCDMVFRNR